MRGYFTTLFDGIITVAVGVVRQVVVGMAVFHSETVHIPRGIGASTTSQFSCQTRNQASTCYAIGYVIFNNMTYILLLLLL